jgi:MoxR-like ATPase
MIVRQKINNIIKELKSIYYERNHIIEAIWSAVLSKHHVLLLGLPGTGKSMLVDEICRRIDGTEYFQWLLTRFSTPEEIFGPVSLKGLENDEYRRILDKKLPKAHICFLDEIFKANAAILNSLLTAINERAYDNGKDRVHIPLISVFGASNELPEEEELDALYDRFILRYDVKYIQESSNWCKLIASGAISPGPGEPGIMPTTISLDELQKAQFDVETVKLPESVINTMRDIKMALEREGVVASDRRWKQTVRVLQARAWLDNRTEIEEQDLELLCDMLWKEPEQRPVLVSEILSVTNPLDLEATKLYDDCLEVFTTFSPDVNDSTKTEVAQKLKMALDKINDILKIADPAKTNKMKSVQETIKQWYRDVVKAIDI